MDKKMERTVKGFALIILLCAFLFFTPSSINKTSNIEKEEQQDKDLRPDAEFEDTLDYKLMLEESDSAFNSLNNTPN